MCLSTLKGNKTKNKELLNYAELVSYKTIGQKNKQKKKQHWLLNRFRIYIENTDDLQQILTNIYLFINKQDS